MSIRITPDNYVAVGQDIIRDPDNFNIDHIIQVRRHLMGYLRNPDRIEFPYLSDLKGLTSKLRDLLLLKLTAQPDGMPYAIANACISQIKRPDALLKLATVDEIECAFLLILEAARGNNHITSADDVDQAVLCNAMAMIAEYRTMF